MLRLGLVPVPRPHSGGLVSNAVGVGPLWGGRTGRARCELWQPFVFLRGDAIYDGSKEIAIVCFLVILSHSTLTNFVAVLYWEAMATKLSNAPYWNSS